MLRASLQKYYPRPRAVGNFHTSITYHFNSSGNVVDVLGEMWYTYGTKYDSGIENSSSDQDKPAQVSLRTAQSMPMSTTSKAIS